MSFLLTKYNWLQVPKDTDVNFKKFLGDRPSRREIVSDTEEWLTDIFSVKPYNDEGIKILKQHPTLVADFIRYELFSSDGVIRINLPRAVKYEERAKYEFLTACWLIYIDSMKRENGLSLEKYVECITQDSNDTDNDIEKDIDEYILKKCIMGFIESVDKSKPPYIRIPFEGKSFNSEDIRQLVSLVKSHLQKMSFTFKNPYASTPVNHYYMINGVNYFQDDPDCTQIELVVNSFDDADKTEYAENHNFADYIKYLLTYERNGMCEYSRSQIFWEEIVQLNRRHASLESRPEPNKVLLILCLALGLGTEEYALLQKLRRKEFGDRTVRARLPFISSGGNEEQKIYDMLKASHWRKLETRRQILKLDMREEELQSDMLLLPRKLLFKANVDLLLSNQPNVIYNPIIGLSQEEVYDILRIDGITSNLLDRFYNTANSEGYRSLKRQH